MRTPPGPPPVPAGSVHEDLREEDPRAEDLHEEEDPYPAHEAAGLDAPTAGQFYVAESLIANTPGKFMFVPRLGWHVYDGTRWDTGDGTAEKLVEQAVIDAARRILSDAAAVHDDKLRGQLIEIGHRTLSSDAQVRGAAAMLSRHRQVLTRIGALNADPYLLNVSNGTLDLRTRVIRAHDPADRLTKVTAAAYRPGEQGDRWPMFLNEALGGPALTIALQQLLGGAGLPGNVIEHVLPVIYGPTGSGKGTFINAVAHAFGDYAISAEPELMLKRRGAHPTGEMDLFGVRLAFVSESDEGKHLAAATVKRLTGGDTIRARGMRQDFVQFQPSHLLCLVTNHLPVMPSGDDPAIWRRVRVVPFDRPPAKVDKLLPDHLRDETDAILTWMVHGFADYWQRKEIDWPDSVTAATAEYRNSSDLLSQFLTDLSVKVDPTVTEPLGAVYKRWKAWLSDNAPDARPGRVQDLKRLLAERGETVKTGESRNKGSVLTGRMFLTDSDDEAPVWT